MAWSGIIGRHLKPAEIHGYVSAIRWDEWKPDFIVVHNTASPSLSSRPNGLTAQHIKNLEAYYRDQQGWRAGPHFFVDDHGVWLFTPPTVPGTHSPSWNGVSLGIEMLGDFASEEFVSGRGGEVRYNTIRLMASLLHQLGLPDTAWKYHIEDTKTNHDCPGKKARADKVNFQKDITRVRKALDNPNATVNVALGDLSFPSSTNDGWKKKD